MGEAGLVATGVGEFLTGASVTLGVGAGFLAVEDVVVLTDFVPGLVSDFLVAAGAVSGRLRVSVPVDLELGFAG